MAKTTHPNVSDAQERDTANMKVLVLGLCRTGTMSMKFALEELGYQNVYHMSSIFDVESHAELWIEALHRKFRDGEADSLTAEFWHHILGDYSAVTDIPAVCFSKELLAAYPSAKIILTTRPRKDWYRSMIKTIDSLHTSRLDRFLLLFATPHIKSVTRLLDLIIQYYFEGSISQHGEAVFETHNEQVRLMAHEQQRDILEYQIGDGWDPICEFLGRAEPDMEFPHVNDTKSFRSAFRLDLTQNILFAAGLLAVLALIVTWRWSN